MASKTTDTNERAISVDDAMRVLTRDYFDDVRGICEEMKRAVKDGEVSSEDEWHDALHEHVDGHQRVIYTHQARVGLCCTDNPDAWEECGYVRPTVEAQMYWAIMADVDARTNYHDVVSELADELSEETV